MLVPYFGYSVLNFLYNCLQVLVLHKGINLWKNILGIIVQLRGSEYSSGVWFLPLLFLGEEILALIMQAAINEFFNHLVVKHDGFDKRVVAVFLSVLINETSNVSYIYGILHVFWGISAGMLFAKQK